MQSPDEIKSRLFSLVNKGIKYDLDRMFRAASMCGDPQKSYLSVHVAGTNGKGSTCAYIESVLRHAGYRTGLYTSPHITDFEERFRVDGVDIAEEVWVDVYREQEKIINDLGLTFFEAATLMAFEIFKRCGVQYAVFETGMGGRLDATNIITPQVSVITKLALDHREYLGDGILEIAGEKLGIVKPGVPVVMLDPGDESIRRLAEERCVDTGSELTFVNIKNADDVVCGDRGVSFKWKGRQYDLLLFGKHQVENALLALATIERIGEFDYQVIYDGMKAASVRGRFQVVDIDGRAVVFDVGHNPDAAAVLVDALDARFPNRRVAFVVGMMKDKDAAAIIDIFIKRASAFYFAKPKTERAANPTDLDALTSGNFDGKTAISQNVEDALRMAIDDTKVDDVICVTGSFYTVSEALKL
jgi:dihydrofolate synthase/folylpolyglutamate synthase